MSKTVTLRLDDDIYQKIKTFADQDNRPISNFIETATLRYINEIEFVDEFEMENILQNEKLMKSLKKGHLDAKNKRGRFV
jgi:predicted transcriptional regulator